MRIKTPLCVKYYLVFGNGDSVRVFREWKILQSVHMKYKVFYNNKTFYVRIKNKSLPFYLIKNRVIPEEEMKQRTNTRIRQSAAVFPATEHIYLFKEL